MNTLAKQVFIALAVLGLVAGLWMSYQFLKVHQVPVLMYHRIGNEENSVWWVHVSDFENQLKFLKEQGYASILPCDLLAHFRWGKPLPEKPVVFTFDDGYLNSMQNAEPLLKKYGFRGIVYLVTEKVADSPSERKLMEGTPALTWPEVREMQKRGTLTFGGHSRTHPNMLKVPDPYWEIRGCYTDIKRKGGFTPDSYCYPNGQFNPEMEASVKRAGFSTALTCVGDTFDTRRPSSFLGLPRLAVYGGRQVYHVETVTNDESTIRLRVWKDGVSVPSFPRLSGPAISPGDGWKDPVSIGQQPTLLTWRLTNEQGRPPLTFELWGDCKLLPHWKQKVNP